MFRVVLIGSILTGKTQFFNQISSIKEGKKDQKKCDVCTIVKEVNQKKLQINVIDTSGSYDCDENRITILKPASLILLFFDVQKENTFEDIKVRWLPYLKEK